MQVPLFDFLHNLFFEDQWVFPLLVLLIMHEWRLRRALPARAPPLMRAHKVPKAYTLIL